MSKLQIPPGQTYPPADRPLTPEERFRRGPYLERHATSGIVELRIPSPHRREDAEAIWRKNRMRWDKERQEWHRPTTRPLETLEAAARKYEGFFPEYAQPRPIRTALAAIGRVDFIVANPQKVTICEWPRGWQPGDEMVARIEHDRAQFDLEEALDWCRSHGAYVVEAADGDYIRCFFDGLRSIRTKGQILRKRRKNSIAQADFAYQ